jgi:1,4-dihydroxy-2-naphthoate octaprenyltransferase
LLIAFLFGIVPVFGSYYLQTERLGVIVILPALSVALLIFLIILINEFPDRQADASVNKKTFVVKYGVKKSIITYKSVLTLSYITAVFMLFFDITFRAGLLYLFTLPLGIWAFTSANQSHLEKTSSLLPNKLTILLHITGSVLLAVGFLIYAQRT